MEHLGLEMVKKSILTSVPKDSFYKKCKAISQGNNEWLRELLFERFMARDSGDEPEDDLKFVGNREVDIEVDGDFIYDYTFCETARDFEIVARHRIDKMRRCYDRKHDYKIKVYLKFCRLTKRKGIPMPTFDDLVLYSLQPDRYQDKLKFFKELLEAYHEEITRALNNRVDDEWVVEW